MSFQKYKLIKYVADVIQTKHDGLIFGGYVRDTILHDHAAKLFYDSLKEMQNEPRPSNDDLYQDKTYRPDLLDRFLVPTDIDCYMTDDNKTALLETLEENSLVRSKNDVPSMYGINDKNLKLMRVAIGVSPFISSLLKLPNRTSFCVDIIYTTAEKYSTYTPPFTDYDFVCNTLQMRQNNIFVSRQVCEKKSALDRNEYLQHVILDIIEKKAVCGERIPKWRMKKMLQKGWSLVHEHYTVEKILVTVEGEGEEECPICIESFKKGDFQLRRSCCTNAIFHVACLKKSIRSCSARCPACRDEIDEYVLGD
jgi:hypothetical protein